MDAQRSTGFFASKTNRCSEIMVIWAFLLSLQSLGHKTYLFDLVIEKSLTDTVLPKIDVQFVEKML